jgi:hypothetical protein
MLLEIGHVGETQIPPAHREMSGFTAGTGLSQDIADGNLSYCGIVNPFLTSVAAQYRFNTTKLFAEVCNETAFISVAAEWGGMYEYQTANSSTLSWSARNFSLGLWFQSSIVVGPTFSFNWIDGCNDGTSRLGSALCDYDMYWIGYFGNETVSGPYSSESPNVAMGPGPTASVFPALDYLIIAGGIALFAAFVALVLIGKRSTGPHFDSSDSGGLHEAGATDEQSVASNSGVSAMAESKRTPPESETIPTETDDPLDDMI